LTYVCHTPGARVQTTLIQIWISSRRFLTFRKVYEMLFDVSTWEAEPILIWVDAGCINQDGLEEKNRQVGMMKSIYSWAYAVAVSLGDSADSGIAMEVIEDVDITVGTVSPVRSTLENLRTCPKRTSADIGVNPC
jgi:hypothetical protein